MAKRFISLLVLATHNCAALTMGDNWYKNTLNGVFRQCDPLCEHFPEDSTTHALFGWVLACCSTDQRRLCNRRTIRVTATCPGMFGVFCAGKYKSRRRTSRKQAEKGTTCDYLFPLPGFVIVNSKHAQCSGSGMFTRGGCTRGVGEICLYIVLKACPASRPLMFVMMHFLWLWAQPLLPTVHTYGIALNLRERERERGGNNFNVQAISAGSAGSSGARARVCSPGTQRLACKRGLTHGRARCVLDVCQGDPPGRSSPVLHHRPPLPPAARHALRSLWYLADCRQEQQPGGWGHPEP